MQERSARPTHERSGHFHRDRAVHPFVKTTAPTTGQNIRDESFHKYFKTENSLQKFE